MQNILRRFNNKQPGVTKPIRQRVIKYLTDNNYNFQQGETSILMRVQCNNTNYPLYIVTYEENSYIRVYTYLESTVPENKRTAIAEYCSRINYNTPFGNLEFDIYEGEVRYKTSFKVGNIEFLTYEILDRLIWDNCNTLDMYYPGFMKIMYTENPDIKAIIQEIENPK